jgi:hypothetical protein
VCSSDLLSGYHHGLRTGPESERLCALEPAHVQKFQNHLPEYLWLAEASAPELLSSSRRASPRQFVTNVTNLPLDCGVLSD